MRLTGFGLNGVDFYHESVRLWLDQFGPKLEGKLRVWRAST